MTGRLLLEAARRPLVLDAATGTRLMAAGLDPATDDASLWAVDRPETVAALHARDIAAGSDVLNADTFGANAANLARFGRRGEVAAVNRAAVALARSAAGPNRFVLGSIGPIAATEADFVEQAEALAGAGVDGLLIETHALGSALRALGFLRARFSLPILVSLAVWSDDEGPFVVRLNDAGADVVGVNCVDPARARAWVAREAGGESPLLYRPSAGHPDHGLVGPEEFARDVLGLVAAGVRFLGGCCLADERHVAALFRGLAGAPGRAV